MGLFGNKKEGGIMDTIRCEEDEYLIWKWSPAGIASKRENAIRYGSSLRVRDGEAAIFVYDQKGEHDVIVGPFDRMIKTANFPILSRIVGAAYGGNSPFQAEIYYINLANVIQVNVPIFDFDIPDPSFSGADNIPIKAVRATITFKIGDYNVFLKKHRLRAIELDAFKNKIKETVAALITEELTEFPINFKISVLHINSKLKEINKIAQSKATTHLNDTYGIETVRVDISKIVIDEESENVKKLRKRLDLMSDAQASINAKNLEDTQRINAGNLEDTLRVQREELQRAQKLQTESNFMGAHGLNQQTDVLKTAATSLGEMGSMGGGDGSGMNPTNMMAGMMMGGAIGGQMAGMMNTIGQGMGQNMQQMNTPPPPPVIQYMVLINGQQSGPFNLEQLQQLKANNTIGEATYVWKQGMSSWEIIKNIPELSFLLYEPVNTPPPPPPGAL